MRQSRLFGSLLAVALLALPQTAMAATGSIAGVYTIDRAKSDDINKAIATTVAKMNFVMRPIADHRLRTTNEPYKHIVITTGKDVTIAIDHRAAIHSPATGRLVAWTREDGEKMKVGTSLQGATLDETFVANDGKRVNHFVLSPDGKRMTMTVTLYSPKLPQPLVYRLAYRRTK